MKRPAPLLAALVLSHSLLVSYTLSFYIVTVSSPIMDVILCNTNSSSVCNRMAGVCLSRWRQTQTWWCFDLSPHPVYLRFVSVTVSCWHGMQHADGLLGIHSSQTVDRGEQGGVFRGEWWRRTVSTEIDDDGNHLLYWWYRSTGYLLIECDNIWKVLCFVATDMDWHDTVNLQSTDRELILHLVFYRVRTIVFVCL